MKYNKDKYTPPFRVGRKQGRAVLDAKGLEVIFMHDEKQAQLYCHYLNDKTPLSINLVNEDIQIYINESGTVGRYLVTWEDAYGDCGADILSGLELHEKYPWVQVQLLKNI